MDAFLQVGGFLDIFAEYNVAIWPMQVVAYLLGVVAIFLVIRKTGYSNRVISMILAFYWLWVGILLCIVYWSRIYPGAYVYGILFIIQGVLFLAFGVIKPRISFGFKPNTYFILGLIIVLYAMIGYPIIGSFFGRVYPRSLSFGLVPCPTVVFTFGLFIMGFPEDTAQTLDDSYNLMCELELDIYEMASLIPFPGTKLFEQCLRDNLLVSNLSYNDLWKGVISFDASEHDKIYIKPYNMTIEELQEYRKKFDEIRLFSAKAKEV